MSRLVIAVVTLSIFAAGSAMAQEMSIGPAQQPKVKTVDYSNGYRDGCLHAVSGQVRNETRYNSNSDYHDGWENGFYNCYPRNTIQTNGDPNGPLKNLF